MRARLVLFLVACGLLQIRVCGAAAAPGTEEASQVWDRLARAVASKEYPEAVRASARFLSLAPPEDARLPEAWYRFVEASREVMRDCGPQSGAYEVLCNLVGAAALRCSASDWWIRSCELLSAEGARRAVRSDHYHPYAGGFGTQVVEALGNDGSRAGVLRLVAFTVNWAVGHRGCCDIGGSYHGQAPGLKKVVGSVGERLEAVLKTGGPAERAAARYGLGRIQQAAGYAPEQARAAYEAFLRDHPQDDLAAQVQRELGAGVRDPLSQREEGHWGPAGRDAREKLREVLGDIPWPSGQSR